MTTRTLVAAAFFFIAPALGAQKAPDIRPYLTAHRAEEVALARTAAPPNVSANATVLVLTPKGYVEAVHGTNDFTCMVFRSFAGSPDDPKFWNPKTVAPQCMNGPSTRTVLPTIMAKIEWALAGATPTELKARIARGYADRKFARPAPGAMAYMLSPKQYLSDENPHWMPHLMFYYDRQALTGASFGAADEKSPIIDASPVDSKGAMTVIYIPTRAWSDGTHAVMQAPGK